MGGERRRDRALPRTQRRPLQHVLSLGDRLAEVFGAALAGEQGGGFNRGNFKPRKEGGSRRGLRAKKRSL